MRKLFMAASLALVMAGVALAQLGSSSSITYHYYSPTNDSPAWVKDVIMADGEGYTNLLDRQGVLVSKQEAVALEVSTETVSTLAETFNESFTNGIANLASQTNSIPTDGISFGLVFPLVPDQSRKTIDGYIVDHFYDSTNNIDVVKVFFSQTMNFEPVLSFPYVTDGGFTTNRVTAKTFNSHYAGSTWTNTVTITKTVDGDSTDYANCHTFYVSRPSSLRNADVWFNHHIRYGKNRVIDYSSIGLTYNNLPLFTGVLTNTSAKAILTIEGGAIKGLTYYE